MNTIKLKSNQFPQSNQYSPQSIYQYCSQQISPWSQYLQHSTINRINHFPKFNSIQNQQSTYTSNNRSKRSSQYYSRKINQKHDKKLSNLAINPQKYGQQQQNKNKQNGEIKSQSIFSSDTNKLQFLTYQKLYFNKYVHFDKPYGANFSPLSHQVSKPQQNQYTQSPSVLQDKHYLSHQHSFYSKLHHKFVKKQFDEQNLVRTIFHRKRNVDKSQRLNGIQQNRLYLEQMNEKYSSLQKQLIYHVNRSFNNGKKARFQSNLTPSNKNIIYFKNQTNDLTTNEKCKRNKSQPIDKKKFKTIHSNISTIYSKSKQKSPSYLFNRQYPFNRPFIQHKTISSDYSIYHASKPNSPLAQRNIQIQRQRQGKQKHNNKLLINSYQNFKPSLLLNETSYSIYKRQALINSQMRKRNKQRLSQVASNPFPNQITNESLYVSAIPLQRTHQSGRNKSIKVIQKQQQQIIQKEIYNFRQPIRNKQILNYHQTQGQKDENLKKRLYTFSRKSSEDSSQLLEHNQSNLKKEKQHGEFLCSQIPATEMTSHTSIKNKQKRVFNCQICPQNLQSTFKYSSPKQFSLASDRTSKILKLKKLKSITSIQKTVYSQHKPDKFNNPVDSQYFYSSQATKSPLKNAKLAQITSNQNQINLKNHLIVGKTALVVKESSQFLKTTAKFKSLDFNKQKRNQKNKTLRTNQRYNVTLNIRNITNV